MSDRIRPPGGALEELLDELKDTLHLFDTKYKVALFAAALGFRMRGDKGGDEPERFGEGIRLEYFEKGSDIGFIDALAVARLNDLSILADNEGESRNEIFECYLHVGLAELHRRIKGDKRHPTDVILDIVDESLAAPDESANASDKARRLSKLFG